MKFESPMQFELFGNALDSGYIIYLKVSSLMPSFLIKVVIPAQLAV